MYCVLGQLSDEKSKFPILLLRGKMITGYNFGDAFGHVCVFRGCWTENFGDLDVLPP